MLTRSDFRPYQNRMVRFMQDQTHCAAWSFMGSGKSVSTLTAIDELIRAKEIKKALVVAPLRVARSVWDAEARNWEHTRHLRVSKVLGDVGQRASSRRPGCRHF